jgi:hypothetical protein
VNVLRTGLIFVDFSLFGTKCNVGDGGESLQYFNEQRSGLNARLVQVGFEVDKVALGQVVFFPPVLRLSLVSVIPPMLNNHSFVYYRRYIILATGSVLQ